MARVFPDQYATHPATQGFPLCGKDKENARATRATFSDTKPKHQTKGNKMKERMKCHLTEAEAVASGDPWLTLPTKKQQHGLRPGDLTQLCCERDDIGFLVEVVGVHVARRIGRGYIGSRLRNGLLRRGYGTCFRRGDRIEFEPRHVLQVMRREELREAVGASG